MFARLLLRDLVISALVVAGWYYGAEWTEGAGPVADALGVGLGVTGGLVAYLAHEWGHLLGALATGSRVHAPDRMTSGFLFSFDSQANSRKQFVIMSLAGFVVTGIAIAVVYALLPDRYLATRVARGAVLSLSFLTVFVEVPILIWSVLSGSTLPQVEVFQPDRG